MLTKYARIRVRFMVCNVTFNNISVISCRSVLLLEETGENHRPTASHWQTLSHNVVSSTPRHACSGFEHRTSNTSGLFVILKCGTSCLFVMSVRGVKPLLFSYMVLELFRRHGITVICFYFWSWFFSQVFHPNRVTCSFQSFYINCNILYLK